MAKDPLARFADLSDAPFPGRRRPVNRPDPDAPGEDPSAWDYRPVKIFFRGADREFFTIGHLATALGRSTVTIRSWESRGTLPNTPFRTPKPDHTPTFGPAPAGRRLYTRSQIEGILRICEELRIITDPHRKPPTEEFTRRVTKLYLSIREKELT